MRWLLGLLAVLALLWGSAATAAPVQTTPGVPYVGLAFGSHNPPTSSGGGYVGPGDIASGASEGGGVRAYNAAFATGSNNGMEVRRFSDSSLQNILILSNGSLDMATALTFAGTDATASCTVAATTGTCTGASSTPHVGSTVAGTGVTQPCVVTAVGTFTGGAGTVTLAGKSGAGGASNPCGTVGSAVTLTFTYGLSVHTLYHQPSGGHDFVQTTNSKQPQLLPNAVGSVPCMNFVAANSQELISSASITTSSQPFSAEGVASWGTAASQGNIMATSGSNSFQMSTYNAQALFDVNNTGPNPTGLTPNIPYVLSGLASTTAGVLNANGTDTTTNTGTGTANGSLAIGSYSGGGYTDACIYEVYLFPSTSFTSTQRNNLSTNGLTYFFLLPALGLRRRYVAVNDNAPARKAAA